MEWITLLFYIVSVMNTVPHHSLALMLTGLSAILQPQQQTRRTLLQRANGTDRQTDGRTPYRFMDPALRNMRTVPIKRHRKRQADKRRQVDVTYRSHQPTVRLC